MARRYGRMGNGISAYASSNNKATTLRGRGLLRADEEESHGRSCWRRWKSSGGVSHYGAELQESATEKAERSVREGLQNLGWTEDDLATRTKGDRAKLQLAVKLRAETTMTLKWIAARLQMVTGASLSNLLLAQQRGKE